MGRNNGALVAIIVPVFNDESYIRCCIDSVLAQTAGFWEAVFVDDASSDGSVAIIEEYCARDARIHLLKNEKNSSAWVARAKGILNVSDTVEYILFADADDTLQPDMVECAYKIMCENPVDILHFGTNVVTSSGSDKKAIESYTRYLQPPVEFLSGRKVFESFVSRSFEGHLWNKMFNAHLLKSVINNLGVDRVLPKAQDKALYWAVCWAKPDLTYRGVSNRLYNYNYGLGIEGKGDELSLSEFEQYLCQAWTENTISEIMSKYPDGANYVDVVEKSRYNLLRHSIRNLMRLSLKDRAAGIDMALSYWNDSLDPARIVCAFAEFTWEDRMEAANILKETKLSKTSKTSKDIKTIGTYYHRMDNGGIQRVIVNLVEIWHKLGYEVVLFTDSEPSENDYDIPSYVKRVNIVRPASKCKNSNYVERGMSIAKLIKENDVDCMVYHSYFSDVLLYDMVVCKGLNVPFILYVHNVFTKFLFDLETKFSTVARAAELANAVICLSETDKNWWTHFNGNVHTVLNPLSFDLEHTAVSERNNHNILFLCRMVEFPKRPGDAITIAKKVIAEIPDAKLFMVGGTDSKRYMERLQNRINKLHLENNIILSGFHKNVEEYYESCSIFLSCSAFEGFPLALCEAMSYGLPIVMYKLPYLEIAKNNDGIISVGQEDVDSAVRVITDLFKDRDSLVSIGNKGREFLENMYKQNLSEQWQNIFESIDLGFDANPNNYDAVVAQMLIEDFYTGVKRRETSGVSAVNEKQDKLIKQCRAQIDMLKADVGALEKMLGNGTGNILHVTKEDLSAVNRNIIKTVDELEKTNNETAKLQKEKRNISNDLQSVLNSRSYKIGRLITFIPRKIRDFFRKIKNK